MGATGWCLFAFAVFSAVIICIIGKYVTGAQCPACNETMNIYCKTKDGYIRYRCSRCEMEIGEWTK